MPSLREVRELLARRAEGLLDEEGQAHLLRAARTLRRRLDRLRALDPETFNDVSLHAALDELAQPPVLSGSG